MPLKVKTEIIGGLIEDVGCTKSVGTQDSQKLWRHTGFTKTMDMAEKRREEEVH